MNTNNNANGHNAKQLHLFTDVETLKTIGAIRTSMLLEHWRDELSARGTSLPPFSPEDPDRAYDFEAVAQILSQPAQLPPEMVQSLLALETLATRERPSLDVIISRRLQCISVNRHCPLDCALEVWFAAPNELTLFLPPLEAAHAQPSTSPSSPPIENLPPASPIQNPNSKIENPLTRFSDPHIIHSIGLSELEDFLKRFANELAAKNLSLPPRAPDPAVTAEAYAKFLSRPDLLPAPLVHALLAIAEFASPKNKRLLEKLASDSDLDISREPEGWALCLWLRAPFTVEYINTLQSHLPPDFCDGYVEYGDPEPGPGDSDSSFSDSTRRACAPRSTLPVPAATPSVEINPCPRNRIARLPHELRQSINRLLAEGRTYTEIIQQLGPAAPCLNKSNLSRWKRGPYQEWLERQHRLEESNTQLNFALEAVRQNETSQIHQATQQIAALRISELFTRLDLSELKVAVMNDPATLARLAQLLPRLSQAGLECERQGIESAKSRRESAAPKPNGPVRLGLSRKALRYAEEKLRLM